MDMKTAMQQMLMFINSFDEEPINPIFLRLMAEQLIEKEKEQIIESYSNGYYEGENKSDYTADKYYYNVYKQDIQKYDGVKAKIFIKDEFDQK